MRTNKYYEKNKDFVQFKNKQRANTRKYKTILLTELKILFKETKNQYQTVTKLPVYKYTYVSGRKKKVRPKIEIIREKTTVYF